jgi:nucleoside-diphosphate-sugar epimerase
MICFVTGATGRLGALLVERLLQRGDEVRCLVRRAGAGLPRGARAYVGDLDPGEPAGALDEALRGAEVVVHSAALTRRRKVARADLLRVNGEGTRRLVAACERAGSVQRLVLVSSLAAIGPTVDGRPLREDTACAPVSDYGESKLLSERALRASALPWTIVRLPGLYGPGDASLLPAFKAARWRLRPCGAREMPLLHFADAVDALLVAVDHAGAVRRTLHAAGAPLTATECGRAIAAAVGKRALPVPLFAPWLRFIDPQRARELAGDWPIDGSSLERLGFAPRVSFEAGAREVAASYAAAGLL